MASKLLKSVGALVVLLISVTVPVLAQSNKADIVGTVTDSNGGAVTDATVTGTKVDTGASRTATTDASGNYQLPLLDIGIYKVTVTKQGFQTVTQENVTLQTQDRLRVDLIMAPGTVTGEVTVSAAPTLVETESSDRGNVVTGREVTELPLSGRNFTQLATLMPGVAASGNTGFGGTGPDARQFNNGDPRAGDGGPGSSNSQGSTENSRFARSGSGALTVNGQRSTNNNFSLDGVDNNEPQFGTIGVFPNPDAIAEFKVTTSIPPAEVGRAAGAVINTTIKSGTNEFHGSGYYYGQNSALNAYHPKLLRDRHDAIARGVTNLNPFDKAVQQIHEFGGTIGGPIFKNRTFFFADYLGQRNNIPFPASSTVPTAKSRNGDFSDFPTIRNPYTGQPFPGNVIPDALISPIAKKLANLFPQATINVFNPGQSNNNYFTQRANKERIDNYEVKIDHKVSEENSLTGRFNEQKLKTNRANLLPGLPTAGFGAGDEVGNTRQITVSDTHAFSPTLLNEFRFGLTQINIGIFNCGVGGACGTSATFADDIGYPNANDGSLEASGGPGLGNFGNGFTEYLGDGGLFRVKSKNPYFADSLTIVHGSHVTKFGGEYRLRLLNTIDGGRSGFLKGNMQYADDAPASNPLLPGQICPLASQDNGGANCFIDANGVPYGGTGNAQANELMSLPAFQVDRGKVFGGPFNLRTQEYGLFVQDDWKVNDRLTLNLGLRYDLFTPPTESDGRLSYYFPEDSRVIVADGSSSRLISTDKNNFGPRAGFAYALDSEKSMVIRGGYGLLYTLDGTDYPPAIRNPPFTNSVHFAQFNGQQPTNARTYFSVNTGPPSISTQIDPANLPEFVNLFSVDREQKNGLVHQFQISYQWQFARDWSLDIGYVGNRTRNLLTTNNIGRGGTGESRNAAGQFLGGGNTSVLLYTNAASSSYNGLQMQLQKRLSNNVQGQVSYTFSRTIDNAIGLIGSLGDSRNGGRLGPINPFDLDADKGRSSLDIPHLLSASAIIDLPFGKGQRYLNGGGAADKLFSGWQFNIIQTARSGFPFTVVCNCGLVRPTQISDPFANAPPGRYLNAAAFSLSTGITTLPANPAGTVIQYGSLGRNTFNGPAIWNTDMSLFKTTALTENVRAQIGLEAFNAWNHAKRTVPINNIGDGGFGRFDGFFPGRVIQYRFKLLF
ncbi:MAG TPA: TonB-dependent receptor [Pyrinomonadaceae bacterium]|nr:TonB-dependent receptor [Pyrinomonadaceae bacterium]